MNTAISALAWKSLLNRRFTVLLTVCSIALSVSLLVGVERLRGEARNSFANTLSGTDLILGARGGPIQLLLYSLFRIGDATNNVSWKSYQAIAAHPKVAWSVPLSLGDSHRGFRVLGTNHDYFRHYRYAGDRTLALAQGEVFHDLYDAVLGAQVARELGYALGDEIILAHGAGDVLFARHDDKPFRVVGILAPTGTPVDRTVHVSLQGIEALHVDYLQGAPVPGHSVSAEQARHKDLRPKQITAALIGLKTKVATFHVQRYINEYRGEPLSAILPGVALDRLWRITGVAENLLLLVSVFVVIVGLMGMLTSLLTSLNERRREMAILRSLGARPGHIFFLILSESLFISLSGIALGLLLLYGLLLLTQPMMQSQLGLSIPITWPTAHEGLLALAVLAAGFLAGLIPGYRSYRLSLADGLNVKG